MVIEGERKEVGVEEVEKEDERDAATASCLRDGPGGGDEMQVIIRRGT